MIYDSVEGLILEMNFNLRRFADKNLEGNHKLRFLGHIETYEALINQLQNPEIRSNDFDKWQFTGSLQDYYDYIQYFYYLGEMYMEDRAEEKLLKIIKEYEEKFKEVAKNDKSKTGSFKEIS